ncbi:MAG: MBOAT family protein [Butyrivibrio sp.]|nr:MBOAT family protein [Butyrivibrio sp.]
MSYISLFYAFLVLGIFLLYYLIPHKYRYLVLLIGSIFFYIKISTDIIQIIAFVLHLFIVYGFSLLLSRFKNDEKISNGIFALGVILTASLLLFIRAEAFTNAGLNLVIPIGLSFYTLQMISYLADIKNGVIEPQKNIFKYVLFMTFFPQIIQGPIPRYDRLKRQLYDGNQFDEKGVLKGIQLIMWGCFLKFMIADKSAIVVDNIFANYTQYNGGYIFHAGILYSIQLYTDFLGCVTISQGVARLFGIELDDNFSRPYFAQSIGEFWRRWHISLSTWFRDYIYIPLGGSRKGKIRRYINTLIVFLCSGLWHGGGFKFIVWGLMHGLYIVFGDITYNIREKIYDYLFQGRNSEGREMSDAAKRIFKSIVTSFLAMLAWIVFRADSLSVAFHMIGTIFKSFSPWIYFNDGIYKLGLDEKQTHILVFSIIILFIVSLYQERRNKKDVILDMIVQQSILVKWAIYICVICIIWIFGSYGFGFETKDFIYGGF